MPSTSAGPDPALVVLPMRPVIPACQADLTQRDGPQTKGSV
jgi:hypothetical protein